MRLPRIRFTVWRMMLVVAFVAIVMGYVASHRIIEVLRSPVEVTGWTKSGLVLADGRTIRLPGIKALPATSVGLLQAVRRGVELGRDGRVYGLVRVHHWCGNDPVRVHIARVDLSYLLAFVGEGQLANSLDPDLQVRMAQQPGGRFTRYGWEMGEFFHFQGWCRDAYELGDVRDQKKPRHARLSR